MFIQIILAVILSGAGVENGDFEAKPGKKEAIPGWTLSVGAMNGAPEPLSMVEIDRKKKNKGRSSLRFQGDNRTRAWRIAKQEVEIRPGGLYELTAHARTEDVRQENVMGTGITQFANCYMSLVFMDGSGETVGKKYAVPSIPTSGWQELMINLKAPETARRAMISLFLSMSGTFWVDDLALKIEGGKELPPPELLFAENFEKASRVPPEWNEVLGARNGEGKTRSKILIDKKTGMPDSPRSLKFSGSARTIQWYSLERTLEAQPGDAFRFSGRVKAKEIRQEGIQFSNLHTRLVFFDANDQTLGSARFSSPGAGTYDWKSVEAAGVAPEGTVKVLVGIFLSMSGEVWFDKLELTRQPGSMPAYGGWLSLETGHLLLRYPEDHPFAKGMKKYGNLLDNTFESICEGLDVKYAEQITLYLYRDGEQGENLTGRPLDFANPEGRAVHQRPNSTMGHEMVHVIALVIGYAQTGLFGEGIAVYLNGAEPKSHHRYAAQLLQEGNLPTLEAMLEAFRDQKYGYPAAGSYCGYLIEHHGIEGFKKLYLLTDPMSASQEVLGKDLTAIETDWLAYLETL